VNDAHLSSLNYKTAILALKDQITVSFVRAAGVLAKGRMFDMPGLQHGERLGKSLLTKEFFISLHLLYRG
jgi:hypothetical protein